MLEGFSSHEPIPEVSDRVPGRIRTCYRLLLDCSQLSDCRGLLEAPARGFLVVDTASIGQLAVQAYQVGSQLRSMEQQVEALRAAARQLDPRSYQSVQNLLAGNDVNYQSLIRDVHSMGYSLDSVNARFRQLFPDDKAVKNMRPDQLESTSRDMNKEIHDSALVAARSQSTLRTIDQNDREARDILSRSQGTDSQVAQLQSAIQMLALIHQNLVQINQTLSAGARASSNVAVRAATERAMERERSARMLQGFSSRESIPEVSDKVRF
jgi:P-type conjugative transfer protein TrbJ